MSTTPRITHAARINALETAVAELREGQAQIIALLQPTAPAKVTTRSKKASPAPAKDESFVTWVRDTAEARAARKATNAEAAAWLRGKGLPTGGSVWEAYKAGERTVRTLKALAAKDAKARAAK